MTKITRITATPVNLPLEAPYLWSYGSLAGFSKTIVEVETSDGVVGIGEGPSHGTAAIINKAISPRMIGRDPIDIAGAELVCLPSWRGVTTTIDFSLIRAFGAVEMALWDIRGKMWNAPLYALLGGAVRKTIAFTDYFGFRERAGGIGGEDTPEAVVAYCERMAAEHGTTYFEGKFFTADPAPSIGMLELLRQRLGPRALIRIDSNMAYSVPAARRIARAIEDLDIDNWEDPVATPEELADLRRHTSIPLSVHGIDVRRYVELGAPDAICTDVCVHGGIARTVRFVGACEQMGIDFWCYSGDSGIQSTVYLHLAAALPWIRRPSQSLFRMQPLDVVAEGPLRPRDNHVRVPDGPGLGVTLDRDRLAYCHRLFVEQGPYDKFHDPDRPGVMRRLPLA